MPKGVEAAEAAQGVVGIGIAALQQPRPSVGHGKRLSKHIKQAVNKTCTKHKRHNKNRCCCNSIGAIILIIGCLRIIWLG